MLQCSVLDERYWGGERMKQKWAALVAVFAIVGMLMACSSEEPVDLEAVEATLTTKPESASSGSPVELQAAFTGMKVSEKASVTFDIRVGDKPKLVDATYKGDGVFSGSFTFPEKGSYTVYIHLYVEDIHLTKKKTVEVQ